MTRTSHPVVGHNEIGQRLDVRLYATDETHAVETYNKRYGGIGYGAPYPVRAIRKRKRRKAAA